MSKNMDMVKNVASIALVVLVLMYFFAPKQFNEHIVMRMPIHKNPPADFKDKALNKKVNEFISLADAAIYKYKGFVCQKYKKDMLKMIDDMDIDEQSDKLCTMSSDDISNKIYGSMYRVSKDTVLDNKLAETMIDVDQMPGDVRKVYKKLYDITMHVKGKFCKNDKFQLEKFRQYLKDLVNGFCSNNKFEDMLMYNTRYLSGHLSYL